MQNSFSHAALGVALLALPVIGQQAASPVAPPADFRVPIHGAAGVDSDRETLWASGDDYKVSFDRGFTFYPVLGEQAENNLTLGWRTASATCAGEDLVRTPAERHALGWRLEYRYESITEVYDIRANGVEQSFVIHARPARTGDLQIVGNIVTPLRAELMEAKHAALVFKNAEGLAVLRYGQAYAIDANGQKTEVNTSYDGSSIRLTVDEGWLDEAAFPVTVDPLVQRVLVDNGSQAFPQHPKVDLAFEDKFDDLLVVYHRRVSRADSDVYARVFDSALNSLGPVLADLDPAVAADAPKVAAVGGSDRWVIAYWIRDANQQCSIRCYLHDKNDLTINSGQFLTVPKTPGTQDTSPDVGGTDAFSIGDNALVVFQRDVSATCANTDNSETFGVLLNTTAGTFGTPFTLAPTSVGTDRDREWPAVNQVSDGGAASWITTWQEFNRSIASDDWDAVVARIRSDGSRAGFACLGPCADSQLHALRPQVEGRGERYLVSYGVRNNTGYTGSSLGREIRVQRFQWPETLLTPDPNTLGSQSTIASAMTDTLENGAGMGFDSDDRSHWAIAYEDNPAGDIYVVRVGYTGEVVERAVAYNTNYDAENPAVTYRKIGVPSVGRFFLAWSVNESLAGWPVYASELRYDPNASTHNFGQGCAGMMVPQDHPNAGSEFWRVTLFVGVPNATSVLLASTSNSPPLPLGSNCFFYLGLPAIIVHQGVSSGGSFGSLRCEVALPAVASTIHLQFVQLDPTTATLKTTDAMTVTVR